MAADPVNGKRSGSFFVLERNTMQYFSLLDLFFRPAVLYPVHVPDDRQERNDNTGEQEYTACRRN